MLAVTRSPHQQLLEGERCVTLNAGGLYLNALFFFLLSNIHSGIV